MACHRIFLGLLVLALGAAACDQRAGETTAADSGLATADTQDTAESPASADTATDATDDGRDGDRVGAPDDAKAFQWLGLARAGSEQAAAETWPASPAAIWPGYALHEAPTYLVILGTKLEPVRGYLVGWPAPPPGAEAVTLPGLAAPAWRYDAGLADLGAGEEVIYDHEVAGTSAVVATYSASRDQSDVAWIDRLGEQYMTRLRLVEAVWQPVIACGQNDYPRFEQAIALLFLECAVLAEAYEAQDPAVAQLRMHEWYAVRRAAIDVTNLVGKRTRHFDIDFGAARFVAGRLVVASGLRTRAWLDAERLAQLAKPFAVPIEDFDDLMLGNGEIGAAALEVAARVGWDAEPAYRKTENVFSLVKDELGEPPGSLVAAAQKRHDWAAFVARAQQIMQLPGDGG